MSATLAISAYPGDAVFSIGALLHALSGEKAHATLAVNVAGDLSAEAEALRLLGADHLGDLTPEPAASAKTAHASLVSLLSEGTYTNVLLPIAIGERPAAKTLAHDLPKMKEAAPGTRFLCYYPLPYVVRHRNRYPELAFARPIRGLAEADADAAAFKWKPPRSNHPANAPLSAKRTAAQLLEGELFRQVFPEPDLTPPSEPKERLEAIHRALGTREWIQLA